MSYIVWLNLGFQYNKLTILHGGSPFLAAAAPAVFVATWLSDALLRAVEEHLPESTIIV